MPKYRVVVAYKARVVYEIDADNAEAAENAAEKRWLDHVTRLYNAVQSEELDYIGAADLILDTGDRREPKKEDAP